jgi:hypothetical protein
MLLQVVNKWIKEYKNSLYKEEGKEERQEEEEGGLVSPALEQDQDLAAYDRYIFIFFIFGGLQCVGHSFAHVAHFVFFEMSGLFMHLHLSLNLGIEDLKFI